MVDERKARLPLVSERVGLCCDFVGTAGSTHEGMECTPFCGDLWASLRKGESEGGSRITKIIEKQEKTCGSICPTGEFTSAGRADCDGVCGVLSFIKSVGR